MEKSVIRIGKELIALKLIGINDPLEAIISTIYKTKVQLI